MTTDEKRSKAAELRYPVRGLNGHWSAQNAHLRIAFERGAYVALETVYKWRSPEHEELIPANVPLILKSNLGNYEIGYWLHHKRRGYGFYTYPEPDIEFHRTDIAAYRMVEMEDMP